MITSQTPADNSFINPETGDWVNPNEVSSGEYTGLYETWSESLHGANFDRIVFNIRGWDEDQGEYITGVNTPFSTERLFMNSLALGHYYDMPYSPDLNLSMEISYDGSDTITTSGGATITNIRYEGNPNWNDIGAWQVGESKSNITRAGRRIWNLSFSYLSDNDLFASNYMSSTYMENSDGYKDEDVNIYNWGQDHVTNGSFASDASWTKNSNWAITGGKAVADGSSSDDINQTSPAAIVGKIYLLKYTISTLTSGTGFQIKYGGVSGTTRTATGTYDEIITATSTDRLRISAAGDAAGTIDDVSVQMANPSEYLHTIAEDDSFYAKVLNYVGNGQKFIFQPDSDANNPSDFAICIIDQSSIKIAQSAYKTFNMSLKIKEVW